MYCFVMLGVELCMGLNSDGNVWLGFRFVDGVMLIVFVYVGLRFDRMLLNRFDVMMMLKWFGCSMKCVYRMLMCCLLIVIFG